MDNVSQADYWQQRYKNGETGWDMGQVSPPLKAYFDDVLIPQANKNDKILIAGAGNAYEVAYLHQYGFTHVYLLDFAQQPLDNFLATVPDFPREHLIHADFFELNRQPAPAASASWQHFFGYAIEQTFFCAIDPARRPDYVTQMHHLLKPDGTLVGLLFDTDFGFSNDKSEPPFGGSRAEYQALFAPTFTIHTMSTSHNSHPSRQGNELFIQMSPKP